MAYCGGAAPALSEILRRFEVPLPSMPAPQMAMAGGGSFSVGEIHVHAAPGMDEASLADLVVRKLEEWQRRAEVAARGAFRDASFFG